MNVLDLFSGIGGFSLGFESAGMRTIAFCEQNRFCQAVLRSRWPEIPIHPDIKTLDGSEYAGAIDVVCGGYHCQPFSVAGNRRGADDPRHLWPEMHRIIRAVRPRWVVAENVGGHIRLGFDEVADALEAEGFTVWTFVIPACAIGAPHRRDRLWIIAHANGKRLQGRDRQLQAGQNGRHQLPEVFPALSSEAGLPNQLAPSMLCGRHDGIPRRSHRLRALGNAIVPQIAALIGQAIISFEQSI